ncbi:hypothetical protein [Sellimonas intestinalis]
MSVMISKQRCFRCLCSIKKNNETILDIQINRGSLEQHFMKIAKGDY